MLDHVCTLFWGDHENVAIATGDLLLTDVMKSTSEALAAYE